MPLRFALPVLLLAAWALGAPARAAERAYPTYVALGYAAPLDTAQGLATPIIVLDHESRGYPAGGLLAVQLRTAQLTAQMQHDLAPPVRLGYRAGVQVIAEGDGTDLYDAGVRQRAQTFQGDAAALTALATLWPERPWRLGWEGERRWLRFAATDDTASTFTLPADGVQVEHRLRLRRQGLLGEEDAHAELVLAWGRRADGRPWSLDPDAAAHADYRKTSLRWEQPLAWSERHRSRLALVLLGGAHLDLLSGYGVGGFGGRESVAGYYRNEVRAERAAVLNASHELRFAEDRRLSLLLDAARAEPLALPYQASSPGTQRLLSAGVGFYYGIRALGGLPVIVRYGQALRIPEGSPEGHRRELLLIVAAGF